MPTAARVRVAPVVTVLVGTLLVGTLVVGSLAVGTGATGTGAVQWNHLRHLVHLFHPDVAADASPAVASTAESKRLSTESIHSVRSTGRSAAPRTKSSKA